MKIKLMYPPMMYHDKCSGYEVEHSRIVPTGNPLVVSLLKNKGFKVFQDDLDIKVWYDNKYGKDKKIDMQIFDDIKTIYKFIDSNENTAMEAEAQKILKKTKIQGYDIICFSVTNETNIASVGSTLALAKVIKEKYDPIIIFGGSGLKEFIEKYPYIKKQKIVDFILTEPTAHFTLFNLLVSIETGDFDRNLSNVLFDRIKTNRYLPYSKKRKEHFKIKDSEFYNNWMKYNSIEEIRPCPDFEGLPLELYKYIPQDIEDAGISKRKILILSYSFIFGCPNKCIFCGNTSSNISFLKNPIDVVEDIQRMQKKYKTDYFFFLNSNINPSKIYVKHIIQEFKNKDLNIMWSDCANFMHLDKNIIKNLYSIGARRLIYGLERPSDRMLNYIQKNISIKRAALLLKLVHNEGIWNELEIICSMPHERESDIQSTINFIKKNKEYINYCYLNKFFLIPSLLTKNPKKYGIKNIRMHNDSQIKGLAFDEVNGLNWNEKIIQMKKSYNKIFKTINEITPNYYNNWFYNGSGKSFLRLFYMYTVFKTKKEIMDYLIHNKY